MPLKSKREFRFLMANKPKLGIKFAHETPNLKALPERAPKEASTFEPKFNGRAK